jgi:hypothetical protein
VLRIDGHGSQAPIPSKGFDDGAAAFQRKRGDHFLSQSATRFGIKRLLV